MVWYAEGSLADDPHDKPHRSGNAITGITMSSTLYKSGSLDNCDTFNPYDPNQQRDPVCANGPADDCHWRFELPTENPPRSPAHLALDGNGNIWFTEAWGGIGRLNPGTGGIIKLPLPPTINTDPNSPAVWVGSSPWELEFDSSGNLWGTEFFDATILKINQSVITRSPIPQDCLQLDANGQNPCVTEVFVGRNQDQPDAVIHTLDIAPDGKIWFVLSKDEQTFQSRSHDTVGQVGFIDPDHGNLAVLLPILRSQYDSFGNVVVNGIGETGGVAVHPQSGDIYFMESWERQLGRLSLAACPQNPHYPIGNGKGIARDDRTVPNDDPLERCLHR